MLSTELFLNDNIERMCDKPISENFVELACPQDILFVDFEEEYESAPDDIFRVRISWSQRMIKAFDGVDKWYEDHNEDWVDIICDYHSEDDVVCVFLRITEDQEIYICLPEEIESKLKTKIRKYYGKE